VNQLDPLDEFIALLTALEDEDAMMARLHDEAWAKARSAQTDPLAELEHLLNGAGRAESANPDELAWQNELVEFQRETEAEIHAASRSSSCACRH
jgi:hypothetical protein